MVSGKASEQASEQAKRRKTTEHAQAKQAPLPKQSAQKQQVCVVFGLPSLLQVGLWSVGECNEQTDDKQAKREKQAKRATNRQTDKQTNKTQTRCFL
jgi:cytochrome c-type biogenesis protein CcmH/NrfG